MRILHLISSARWTGAADPVVSLAQGLQLRGHEVYLACIPERSLANQAAKRGLLPLDIFKLNTNNPLTILADIKKLSRFIRDKRLDVLHLHLSHDHWLGSLAARLSGSGVKVVRTLHRFNKLRADPLHGYLFKRLTDFTISLSDKARRELIRRLGLPPHRLATIYGGVDEVSFHPRLDGGKLRQRLGLSNEAQLVGLVSHLHADRGHEQALAALPLIKQQSPTAKLVFLGETDEGYYHQLKGLVEQLGLGQEVIFMVDELSDDWPKTMAMLDVVIYLAPGSEDSARAVLEAMALGKPVVAANLGAIAEIIKHRHSGLIIQDAQPQTLASAVGYLLTHSEEAVQWGRAARQQIEARFTNRLRAEHTEAVYLKLVAGRAK